MLPCLKCNIPILVNPSDIHKSYIICPKCKHVMIVKYEKTNNNGYAYYTHDLKLYDYR